jgi:hypothetical protein
VALLVTSEIGGAASGGTIAAGSRRSPVGTTSLTMPNAPAAAPTRAPAAPNSAAPSPAAAATAVPTASSAVVAASLTAPCAGTSAVLSSLCFGSPSGILHPDATFPDFSKNAAPPAWVVWPLSSIVAGLSSPVSSAVASSFAGFFMLGPQLHILFEKLLSFAPSAICSPALVNLRLNASTGKILFFAASRSPDLDRSFSTFSAPFSFSRSRPERPAIFSDMFLFPILDSMLVNSLR